MRCMKNLMHVRYASRCSLSSVPGTPLEVVDCLDCVLFDRFLTFNMYSVVHDSTTQHNTARCILQAHRGSSSARRFVDGVPPVGTCRCCL